MISIKNLVKHYNNHIALDHIDLNVGKGVILGLLGPNGAGKTTLVSILNGLIDFQEGEIEIFGLPLSQELKAIRKCSSFTPQSLALYDNLTVLENLRFLPGFKRSGAKSCATMSNMRFPSTGCIRCLITRPAFFPEARNVD